MSQQGTIDRLVTDRGFGWIDGTDDHHYFFHRTDLMAGQLLDDLIVGDPVVFAATTTPKGPRAVQVVRA